MKPFYGSPDIIYRRRMGIAFSVPLLMFLKVKDVTCDLQRHPRARRYVRRMLPVSELVPRSISAVVTSRSNSDFGDKGQGVLLRLHLR